MFCPAAGRVNKKKLDQTNPGEKPSERRFNMFEQIKLPYAFDALEPHIDAATMETHYLKHHAAYTKNLNDAVEKAD